MVENELDTETVIKTIEVMQDQSLKFSIVTGENSMVVLVGKEIKKIVGDITGYHIFDYFQLMWQTNEDKSQGEDSNLILKNDQVGMYYQSTCELIGNTSLSLWILTPICHEEDTNVSQRNFSRMPHHLLVKENVFLSGRLRSLLNKSHELINQMKVVNTQLNSINSQVTTQNRDYQYTNFKLSETSDNLQYYNRRLNMLMRTSGMIGFEMNLSDPSMFFYPNELMFDDFELLRNIKSLPDFIKLVHHDDRDELTSLLNSNRGNLEILFRLKVSDLNFRWIKMFGERYEHGGVGIVYGLIQNVDQDINREFSIYESEGVHRDRISQTIHDQIAQWLVGVRFMIDSVPGANDQENKISSNIGDILDDVIQRSRGIIQALKIDLLDYESDEDGYTALVDILSKVYPSKISFNWFGSPKIANFRISYQLFVIFQEALIFVLQTRENPVLDLRMEVFKSRISLSVCSSAFNDFDNLRTENQGLRVILHKCKITNAEIHSQLVGSDQTRVTFTINS